MKAETEKILRDLVAEYALTDELKESIKKAFFILYDSFCNGGRLYLCGNGGSAADCEHIVGELMKCFRIPRPIPTEYKEKLESFESDGKLLVSVLESGLPAVSLCGQSALITAFSNDKNPEAVFAQQVFVLGRPHDVLVTISTSGNSRNCILAAIAAKAKGMRVILLGGNDGGKLRLIVDEAIIVPKYETYKVQELHLPIYHCLCAMLENEFFGNS